MKSGARLALIACLGTPIFVAAAPGPQPLSLAEEVQHVTADVGRYGGRLVVGQRSEPKTLNPVTATDAISREVIARCNADLISINRASQRTEPALAKSWKVSPDGHTFT